MALRERLVNSEEDDLLKEVDDLDAVYLQKLKEDGMDEDLLMQFMEMLKEDKRDE